MIFYKGLLGLILTGWALFSCTSTPYGDRLGQSVSSAKEAESLNSLILSYQLDSAQHILKSTFGIERPISDSSNTTFLNQSFRISCYQLQVADSVISTGLSERFRQMQDTSSLAYISFINSLAFQYLLAKKTDSAAYWAHKAIFINSQSASPNHEEWVFSYRTLGKIPYGQRQYSEALKYFTQADSVIRADSSIYPGLQFELYSDLGNTCLRLRKLYEMEEAYQSAEDIAEKYFYPLSHDRAKAYLYTGYANHYLARLRKAETAYEKAFAIFDQHPPVPTLAANGYFRMASLMDSRNNPQRALDYYQRAMQIYKDEGADRYASTIAGILHNMAIIQNKQRLYQEAISHIQESLIIYHKLYPTENGITATAYMNLGSVFLKAGELDSAALYVNKALNIYKSSLGNDHGNLVPAYAYLGDIASEEKSYLVARKSYQEGLRISQNAFGDQHLETAKAYRNLAILAFRQDQHDEAFSHTQAALGALLNLRNPQNLLEVPTVDESTQATLPLFQILLLKAQLLSENGQKEADLLAMKSAMETYLAALAVANNLRVDIKTENDKLSFLDQAHVLFEGAFELIWQLYEKTDEISYIEQAFVLAEQSRAILLLENWQEEGVISEAGISHQIEMRREELAADISFYERKMAASKDGLIEVDSSQIVKWQSDIFGLRKTQDSLMGVLQSEYPEFFRRKVKLTMSRFTDIQKDLLKKGEVMVEYVLSGKNTYAILVSVDSVHFIRLPDNDSLGAQIEKMRFGIEAWHSAIPSQRTDSLKRLADQSYKRHASKLYKNLILPLSLHISHAKKLIIVPDGILGYLPFELLLENEVDANGSFADFPYLMKKYRVSYSYSATLLNEMSKRKIEPVNKEVLAMALSFKKASGEENSTLAKQFPTIPYSLDEVKAIEDIFHTKALLEADARRESFLKLAPSYAIIHFSTHAILNDKSSEYSYLALAHAQPNTDTGRLYVSDLYHLRLNAELVVLSACETGLGQMQAGEGIISMARGFSYAGTRSIIPTLWQVNDKITARLVERFYLNLQSGLDKDEALRQARLVHLSETNGSRYVHPYYWGAMIAVGDMRAVEVEEAGWW